VTAEQARDEYRDAVLAGDRRRAFGVVDAARAAGLGLRTLYLQVFQPTQAAMSRLYDELFAASRPATRLLVAACADSERHEVGLRMLCDLLELEGWDTIFLGASVPVADLVALIRQRRPHVVALSASLEPHLPRLAETIRAIREGVATPPLIAVGGRPFVDDPTLAQRVGADVTARDAAEAVARFSEAVAA
jgi:methanogenic corrinoid protein MtbC1